ncbi:MAG: hypothetical protein MH321_09705 [Leptospiraceae bacterium]|nr:hypothetical protein [Leptospiraceae bacterium]
MKNLIILLLLFPVLTCSNPTQSPQDNDFALLLVVGEYQKATTCSIIALDGTEERYNAIFVRTNSVNVPALRGSNGIFLRVFLNPGQSLEFRSINTNLDNMRLGYFKSENCVFDSRTAVGNSMQNVKNTPPSAIKGDFSTETSNSSYQVFTTSASGFYNIRLFIDPVSSNDTTTNDITVNYK